MKKYFLTIGIILTSILTYADTYSVDNAVSSVEWKAGKKIGSYHNGKIQIKNGQIEVNSKGLITAARLVIDMKTISNDDLKDSPDYQKKLVGHLSSEDFFNVEKFPESTFKLTSIKLKSGSKDQYIIRGDLSIIGTTKPIEFSAKISTHKNTLNGSAVLKIERLNWGLQYGSSSIFKSLTADKIINDSFELTLKIVAKK